MIYHKIGAVILKNKKLLMCRKYNEPHFILPGGKIKQGETPEKTLKRELKEELSVSPVSISYYGIYETPILERKM